MSYNRLDDWKKLPELRALGDLPHPPKTLYFQGQWDPTLFESCVAIVGSRKTTEYGKRVIEQIVPQLVFEKKTIVSGFMYGVDQYAHEQCIACGGKTIAVLGWGISNPLFDTDRRLSESIVSSGGLILSEWEDQKPTLWTFPVRNRIVAALCSDVIVVEAALKSGSLITANLARKLKRTLWAVPGPITSRVSEGTNALIASGHARMWAGAMKTQHKHREDPLLDLLESQALTTSEIARALGKTVSEIGAQLSMFTLTGELIEREGKYYVDKN